MDHWKLSFCNDKMNGVSLRFATISHGETLKFVRLIRSSYIPQDLEKNNACVLSEERSTAPIMTHALRCNIGSFTKRKLGQIVDVI